MLPTFLLTGNRKKGNPIELSLAPGPIAVIRCTGGEGTGGECPLEKVAVIELGDGFSLPW